MDVATPGSAAERQSELRAELAYLRDTVNRFVQAEIVPNEARWAKQQHVDRAAWEKAGALGPVRI